MRRVFNVSTLDIRLCYAVFRNTNDYENATVQGIARALQHVGKSNYSANIYVDALSKSKRHEYGTKLRRMGIKTHKIQGIERDESHALIRLADAIAGVVRDANDKSGVETIELFQWALERKLLIEV